MNKKAKHEVIENSSKRMKMILYCEGKNGGIQGIMMDFFIDDNGVIANEFYRIDEEGNLLKIESGIKPLMDKNHIEKVFKQFFLKY